MDAEEIVRVEKNHPNPDGFGVYALFWGKTTHVADRKDRIEADEVCLALNNILAERIRANNQPKKKEAYVPKILLTSDHDLAISASELESLDIVKFEVSPWAHNGDGTISTVENLEDADGVGVYARLADGLAVHVKDFDIDGDMTADDAQNAAAKMAETLNAYLPGNEPVLDEHLEAAYEDRVSGMDFDWEY